MSKLNVQILTKPKLDEWVWELESRLSQFGRHLDRLGQPTRQSKFKKFLDTDWSRYHSGVVFPVGKLDLQVAAKHLVALQNRAHDLGFPVGWRVVELLEHDVADSRPDFIEIDKPQVTWRVPQYASVGGSTVNTYGINVECEPGSGNCLLRATACVDGEYRERVVDIAPILGRMERWLDDWHSRAHSTDVVSGDADEWAKRVANTARGLGQRAAVSALYGGIIPTFVNALVPPELLDAIRANEVVARARAGDKSANASISRTAEAAATGDPAAQQSLATMQVIDQAQKAKAKSWWALGRGSAGATRKVGPFVVGHLPYEIVGNGRPVVTSSPRGGGSGIRARQTLDYRPTGGGRIRDMRSATPAQSNTRDVMRWAQGSGYVQGRPMNYQWVQPAPYVGPVVPTNQPVVRTPWEGPRPPALPPGVPTEPHTGVPPWDFGYPYPWGYGDYGSYGDYGVSPGSYGGAPVYDPFAFGDPYAMPIDPYFDLMNQRAQYYDPDTQAFYSHGANQQYDPETDTFAPAGSYNPYNPWDWPVYPDPYGLDPAVMGWFTRVRKDGWLTKLFRRGAA